MSEKLIRVGVCHYPHGFQGVDINFNGICPCLDTGAGSKWHTLIVEDVAVSTGMAKEQHE